MTVRRMILRDVPQDLFGTWSGKLVLAAPGCAPMRVEFFGDIEFGFERSGDRGLGGADSDRWRVCGAVLNSEICRRLVQIRMQSWVEAEAASEEAGRVSKRELS